MKLTILNCYDDHVDVEIGDIENVLRINVLVLSGDEIIRVIRKDGTCLKVDSDRHRRQKNHYDGDYTIYDASLGINRIDEWSNRHDSDEWILERKE